MRLRMTSLIVAATCLGAAHDVRAEDAPRVHRLAHDPRIDGAVTATGVLWMVAAELLKPELVPEKCRWCYRAPDGISELNVVDRSVRRSLKWQDEALAGALSSVIGFAALPAAAFGLPVAAAAHDNALSGAPVDSLLIAEATTLAMDLNQLVKFAFARERPFVHYLPRTPAGVRGLTSSPSDDNLSFYSGHTNFAFAVATSSATVSFLRGYRLAPLVLGVGLLGAAAVGYLRIAADKHYLSDVTVGAVVGSLIGTLVPLVFHPRSDPAPTTSALPQPLAPMSTPLSFDAVW